MKSTLQLVCAGAFSTAYTLFLIAHFSYVVTVLALIGFWGIIAFLWFMKESQREQEFQILQDKVKSLAELKDQFLSNVSHEFRSPLSSVKGFLDLILRQSESFSDKHREYLLAMREGVDRLRSFIDNVMDMTKIDAGVMEYNLEPVDLSEIAEKAMASVKGSLQLLKIESAVNVSPRLCVYSDPELLRKIFVHLLTNAINATQEGGCISLWAKDNGAQSILMGVTDSGVGISDELLPHIFNKFEQNKSQLHQQVRKSHGSGLGLSIVKSLVEGQNGKVWVEKSSSQGSTISFSLPKPQAGMKMSHEVDVTSLRKAS